MAVADSWREVKKAELVENTNSRSRFLFHLVRWGHGKELPWGLGQWGSGQLATCGKKEGVLIYIYSYICIIYIKYQISISQHIQMNFTLSGGEGGEGSEGVSEVGRSCRRV